MSDPYVGEIRMFGGNFAPAGWEFCNGELYPIAENEALFTLIGTTYGGDGETTFAVPDLRSRVPMHITSAPTLGEMAGVESVTLTTNQMPVHTHSLMGSDAAADSVTPAGNVPAEASKRFYLSPGSPAAMSAQAIGVAGGSQPHDNMQPYTVITFIISVFGIFPQRP